MVYATKTFEFQTKKELLTFSDMLYQRAEELQDLAWVETHNPQETEYENASILDTIVEKSDAQH